MCLFVPTPCDEPTIRIIKTRPRHHHYRHVMPPNVIINNAQSKDNCSFDKKYKCENSDKEKEQCPPKVVEKEKIYIYAPPRELSRNSSRSSGSSCKKSKKKSDKGKKKKKTRSPSPCSSSAPSSSSSSTKSSVDDFSPRISTLECQTTHLSHRVSSLEQDRSKRDILRDVKGIVKDSEIGSTLRRLEREKAGKYSTSSTIETDWCICGKPDCYGGCISSIGGKGRGRQRIKCTCVEYCDGRICCPDDDIIRIPKIKEKSCSRTREKSRERVVVNVSTSTSADTRSRCTCRDYCGGRVCGWGDRERYTWRGVETVPAPRPEERRYHTWSTRERKPVWEWWGKDKLVERDWLY
ncbi:MAG: hypothetical protein M1834_004871 [Cirrosporium novae-zelandiae]|nr:MAG: hypothetical protein M1834_004871 [Cirrosporium novae-zelandiae]